MTPPPLLAGEQVVCGYDGPDVLKGITLQIGSGQFVGLIGPNGAGKTTNALGLIVRMLGHDKKTLMIQFLKWNRGTGEYLFQKKVKGVEVKQFGRNGWHGYKKVNGEDRRNCLKAMKYTKVKLSENKIDLLILDEINLAVHLGLLKFEEVNELLDNLPYDINVVLESKKVFLDP